MLKKKLPKGLQQKPREGEKRMIDLIYTILSIVCLIIGFYFGFRIGKDLQIPKVSEKMKHPIKTIKEEKKQEEEEEELSKVLRNLDNYDGTSLSQEEL